MGTLQGGIQQNQPHGVLPVFFVFCTGKQFEVDIFIVIIFYWLLRYIETVYLIGDFCGQDICGGNPYRNLLYLSSKLVVPVFATNNLFLNKIIFFGNPFYVYLFNLEFIIRKLDILLSLGSNCWFRPTWCLG